MLRVVLWTAPLILFVASADARDDSFRPGAIVSRATTGGVKYAVYVPQDWKRRRPLPLVVWVPIARRLPSEVETLWGEQKLLERMGGEKGGAFYCAVLLESHNKENARYRARLDDDRYVRLLERDVLSVEAVIEDVRAALPVQPGAVALRGSFYAAEVALGIAIRRPERFAGILLTDTYVATMSVGDDPTWFVMPDAETVRRARRLPILLSYAPSPTNRDKRAQENRDIRDVLVQRGFENVVLFEVDASRKYPKNVVPEAFARFAEVIARSHAREGHRKLRDDRLAKAREAGARGDLSSALTSYRAACKLEEKHGLVEKGRAVYAELEAAGRKLLEEADALPAAKRKAAHDRVVRWFKGTPLGEEALAARSGAK